MGKKGIILFVLIIMISFSLIIYIPIAILSVNISSYDIIDESESFIYEPSSPSSVEKLYINIEFGDIEIRYIEPRVDYLVKIDMSFELSGLNLTGKNHSDFFNIIWHTTNTSAYLTVELSSQSWFDDKLWVSRNVDISVSIRSDVVFDIITRLAEGNYEISVPWAVTTGNLLTNVSNGNISYDFKCGTIEGNVAVDVNEGDIFYNFDRCTIGGNITGITREGDLVLKSYNVEYTQNCNWILNNNGDMNVEISQYKEMGANVTCTAWIIDGMLDLFYKDISENIGAYFFFPLMSGNPILPQEGFNITFQSEKTWLISSDFPTINNYNLTLYITNPCTRCRNIALHSD
ncbi:MAG: hypothetical protein ACFFB0_15775 [Promethearchaeota archaeon]